MKMTKEELQKEIGRLETSSKILSEKDEMVRKNISKFLGSVKQNTYSSSPTIEVLEWSGIYFELGKIMARRDWLEEVRSMRDDLNFLLKREENKPL